MVTLRDVANRAGVSVMSVSNALNGTRPVSDRTRAKVLKAAEELGYRANPSARMLRSGSAGIIKVVIANFALDYYAGLLNALDEQIGARGYGMAVATTHRSYEEIDRVNPLDNQLCDGLIVTTPWAPADQILKAAGGKPLVLHEDNTGQRLLDTVNLPNEAGAYTAIEHLAGRGCRDIAIIGDVVDDQSELMNPTRAGHQRFRGCWRAMRDLGLDYDRSKAVTFLWSPERARQATDALLDAGVKFDGVFAMTDDIAFGVMQSLAAHGLSMPGDVKVVGFDGTATGTRTVPTLTTIAPDVEAVARELVHALVGRIEGDQGPARTTTVGYRLIARESA